MRTIIWPVLIIGGFLFGVIALEKSDQIRKRRYTAANSGNPTDAGGRHQATHPSVSAATHPSEEEHRIAEQQHWLAERIYFRRQFITALTTLVFAAVAAGGAVWTYVQTKKQADAAIEAARAARDQAENMDRPWIKMVSLEHPDISFTGPGTTTQWGAFGKQLEVFLNESPQIKNVGRTPATHVHVRVKLVIHRWANGWGDFSAEQKAACADAQAMTGGYDVTLFPDDPFDGFGTGDGVVLSEENISIAGETEYIAPAIVGCIDYQFSSSPKHHQTRFLYEVFRSDDRSRIFTLRQDVPASGITLIRDPQYDYAD